MQRDLEHRTPVVKRVYECGGPAEIAPSITLDADMPDVEWLIAVTHGTMWFKLRDGTRMTAGHGTLVSLAPGELVEYGAEAGRARFMSILAEPTPAD